MLNYKRNVRFLIDVTKTIATNTIEAKEEKDEDAFGIAFVSFFEIEKMGYYELISIKDISDTLKKYEVVASLFLKQDTELLKKLSSNSEKEVLETLSKSINENENFLEIFSI